VREHDGTAGQEKQTPVRAKYKFKNKIFRGTLKRPRYQPETASAVLMKYLVESDQERQIEPPVDPIDAFFKSNAARIKPFSPCHQNSFNSRIFAIVSEVEMIDILQETKPTLSLECSFGFPDESGIKRKRVCDENSSTSSNMATYQQFTSQLTMQ
jgi:hypothetical protein